MNDASRGAGAAARGGLLALALLCPAPVPAVDAPVFEEHNGGFVLELGAPAAGTRGQCVEVGIYNFGSIPDGRLWVVAREVDGSQADYKPGYHAVARVNVAARRAGKAQVCLSKIPGLSYSAQLPTLDVAVYSATASELAQGRWSGPDGSVRRSVWLRLSGELWRTRADTPNAARASR